MKPICLALMLGLLAVAGCGDDEPDAPAADETKTATVDKANTATDDSAGQGTSIELAKSEFGSILVDSKAQAIYIFERDRPGRTVCYADCAEAWPPVLTEGEPRAGKGVEAALLGTLERRDGDRQVTYAGKPLYFYAHERPGEVRCHNVSLNGGLWWVVGA